jgi:hypothetical protein
LAAICGGSTASNDWGSVNGGPRETVALSLTRARSAFE